MRTPRRLLAGWVVGIGLASAAVAADPPANPAAGSINADDLLGHIRTLASDEFEGRLPGTPGEERTVAYLTEAFRRLGLKPGNPDGTFVQEVPLVGFQATAVAGTIRAGARAIDLKFPDDW